jgi:hypothetical protein
MRVTFRLSGGFAGTIRGVDLDTARMSDPDRRRLRTLVEGSGIEGKTEFVSERSRDLSLYEIRILREEGAASLVCDQDHLPDSARALLSYLAERARPMPPDVRRPPSEPGEGGRA